MCEVVKKLIRLLEPYTLAIQKDRELLDEKTNFKETIDHFKNYINGDYHRIFSYDDDNVIKVLLEKQETSYQEFNACKYIITSPLEDVKKLPQYSLADKFIRNFFDYTLLFSEYIDDDYDKLSTIYKKELLMQKYYNILNSENVFIENIKEFMGIFDNFVLTLNEKIEIIKYINVENNKEYANTPEIEKEKYDLLEFQRVIGDNQKLFENKYQELLDIVDDYVDINKNIRDIVNNDLINKIDIRNVLLAKKIWLIKRVDKNYEIKSYDKANDYLNEFNDLNTILKRIENVTDKLEIVKVIRGEC